MHRMFSVTVRAYPSWQVSCEVQELLLLSDIPGQSGSPAVLPGVFSQLPGSCLIGVSHFPYSGPEVLRSSIQFPWILKLRKLYPLKFLGLSEQETKPAKLGSVFACSFILDHFD